MTTTTRTPINWTYVTVKTIVTLFMLGAASISFMHIVDVSTTLGLTWEAWTVPFAIDGLAVLGLIGRSARFAESTKRAGLKLMCGAGVLSLACNVLAGDNLGQRLYGVLVVAGFMTAEWYSAKLIAAPAPVVVTVDDEKRARRSAAAVKAAATRRANAERLAAEKAEAAEARREAREARRLAAKAESAELFARIAVENDPGYVDRVAPVSPAVAIA